MQPIRKRNGLETNGSGSRTRRAVLLLGFILAMASCQPSEATDHFTFNYRFESRTSVDSSRKDYGILAYTATGPAAIAVEQAYDKTFMSSVNDLYLALRGDISPTQFLDFRESLHYQTYRPDDYTSFTLDTFKYKYLDHLFDLTWGLSLGDSDVILLDYIHNVWEMPIDSLWNYQSNRAKGRFNHQFNDRAALQIEGTYEEREYPNDSNSDFKEGGVSIEVGAFIPEKLRYSQIGNTTRGDRQPFEKVPTGFKTQKAIDYYTTWSRKPGGDEPEAKYLTSVARGDLHLSLTADLRSQDRVKIDNGFYQPSLTLRTAYDMTDTIRVCFDDTYYERKHNKESDFYALFDHWGNRAILSSRHKPDDRFVHTFTLADEVFGFFTRKEQDYRIDSIQYECFYHFKHSAASLCLKETLVRYGNPRLYYQDSDQFTGIFGYDYPITPTFLFHLKDEWTDLQYHKIEDYVYSSFVRNVWRVSLEKILCPEQGLELGYQSRNEKHRVYTAGDVIEKSLFLSWLSHF